MTSRSSEFDGTEVASVSYVESVAGSISDEFVGAYDAIATRR